MSRLFPVFLLLILISGCKKEKSYFAWERTYGTGEARFIRVTSDSGLITCGVSENQPYFLRLDKNKTEIMHFSAGFSGVFTSAWYDTSGYITAGSTNGSMLLMRHSITGRKIWEKTADPVYNIEQTQLLRLSNGDFLAIGSESPDTTYDLQTGLLFIRFDSTGQVLNEAEYKSGLYIAAYEAVIDNSDNIYLALTRKEVFAEPKATVARFNSSLQKLWETELSNNPAYGAAALAVINYGSAGVFVSGRTELPKEGGELINNSFIAAVSKSGSVNWKKYPENSNSGTGLLINSAGELVLLNSNCYIVNLLDPSDGTDGGRIRMFDVCDPYTTDAYGFDFDIDFNNDYILAGSLGGSFYLAVKPMD